MSIALKETEATQFDYFRKTGGRFRISLTGKCNARCWFCHNEGDVPPWQVDELPMLQHNPHILTTEDYIRLVEVLLDLDIQRLYFTGGEPLISSKLEPLLASIPEHTPEAFKVALATNGVILDKKVEALKKLPVDKVKISLHAFTNETMMKVERLECIDRVKNAIRLAKEAFPEVEINTLLMPENQHEIFDIIDFAQEVGVPIEVLELVWTSYDANVYDQKRLSTADVAAELIRRGGVERVEETGIGVNLRIIEIGDIHVKLMDHSLGRLYVGMCESCPVRKNCVEGFWAIRVDSAGFAQPCLLRDDLKFDLKPYIKDSPALKEVLPQWIGSLMSGTAVPAD